MFCRYWRMTPRDVDQLTSAEYRALWDYLEDENRRIQRENRRNARRGH